MNFDDNLTELFDRYLTGQMTEVEEREFLDQLNNDPALKQAYENHRALVAGIREARREELKDYIKQNAKIRYIGNVWGPKWVISSAAIVVILVSAFFIVEYVVKPNNKAREIVEATEDAAQEEAKASEVPAEANEALANDSSIPTENEVAVVEDNSQPNTQLDVSDDYNNLSEDEQKGLKPSITKSIPIISGKALGNKNKVTKTESDGVTIDVYYEVAKTTQYKYDGSKLTLYKFPYEDDVVIYQTDGNKDYLAWQRAYYTLSKDNKAHPLQRVTDKEILKTLPSLISE